MAAHSSVLAGEAHGQKSLAGYGPQGHKKSYLTEVTRHTHTEQQKSAGDKAVAFWNAPIVLSILH